MVITKTITIRKEGFTSILCAYQSSLNIIAITEGITERMGIRIAKIAFLIAFTLIKRDMSSR